MITGTYDVGSVIKTVDPLVLDTATAAQPTTVVVAVTKPGAAAPVAATGSAVSFSFQMYSWTTGEVYDGTSPGVPRQVTVDSNDLTPTLNEALHNATAGMQLIVMYPVGLPGIPDFVPDDVPYYLVVDVVDVQP